MVFSDCRVCQVVRVIGSTGLSPRIADVGVIVELRPSKVLRVRVKFGDNETVLFDPNELDQCL